MYFIQEFFLKVWKRQLAIFAHSKFKILKTVKLFLKKNKHFIAHRDEFGEAYAIPFASASMSVSASGCMEPILDLNYNW